MNILCNRCGGDTGEPVPTGPAKPLAALVICDLCSEILDREAADRKLAEDQETQRARAVECLPIVLRSMRFADSPAPRHAIRAAMNWSGDGGQLVLTGPIGTGKTGLAAAAVFNRLIVKPITWVSVPVLLAGLTGPDPERAKALEVIKGKRALVLDDLDKFKPSEWAASQLFAAIDNALTHNTDLIVTTNKTPGEIAGYIGGDIGPAIASRLASCNVVRVDGEDHRLERKAAA